MHKSVFLLVKLVVVLIFIASASPRILGQSQKPEAAQDQALDLLVAQFNAQPPAGRAAFITSPGNFAPYFLVMTSAAQSTINAQLFHDFEEQRIDKQVASASPSKGATSAANTGSVPWLFGFAAEHGALTQSVENNIIVFRGNIANVISALDTQDYLSSYAKLHQQNALIRNIAKTSFSVSFNASQGASASSASSSGGSGSSSASSPQSSLAGFSFHYDVFNRRDPRDSKWENEWATVRLKMRNLPNATAAFRRAIEGQKSPDWQGQALQALQRLGPSPTDPQVRALLKQIGDDLVTRFGSSAEVKAAAQEVAEALVLSRKIEDDAVTKIMHSPTVSFEYSYVRQSSAQIPSTIQGGTPSLTSSIPNLSNFNFIFNTYLVASSLLSLNGSFNIFNSIPTGGKVRRVRDFRFSGQVDIPMKEIANVGKPTLTFSGVFLNLLQEPVGQQVIVNGVAVTRTGVIGLGQAKLTVPVKGSGVKIPISFTVANRTELIKEHDVRGAIGVTFDLDSLFSKPK
jgi:hypothetical protein